MEHLLQTIGSRLTLSVVIPVRNGEVHLANCLEALAASTRKPDEIVVVDDSSDDRSAAVAQGRAAKVLFFKGGPWGPATARNHGVSASSGEIIVFLDCDVAVHRDALALMEKQFLAQPDLAALFGSYDDSPSDDALVSGYRNLLHHHVHQRSRREAATFWAGCGAVRRNVFKRVGGFDETYRWASIEDIELGLRLHGAGYRVQLCPQIQGTHRKRWSLLQMVHTDVFRRAVPWTRILLGHGSLPNDLNLRWENRLSVIAAWMPGLLLIFDPADPRLLGAAAASVALLLVCNWSLYGLFYRRRGCLFAIAAIALHWLHYLYTGATFVVVALESWLRSLIWSARHLQPETPPHVVGVRD